MFEFEHLALGAKDTSILKDWYVGVLGAELVFQMKQTPPAFLVKLGGVMIEIYNARSSSELVRDNGLAGWRHIALKVKTIDDAREYLKARGIVFKEEVKPAGGGGRVLFFQDPEGNLLHLVERFPEGYR